MTLSWATTDALAYSFSVTGTDTQVATLTLGTGAVTGTATPTDNDADFEGIALPAMVTLYGVLVECTTARGTTITVAGTAGLAGVLYHYWREGLYKGTTAPDALDDTDGIIEAKAIYFTKTS